MRATSYIYPVSPLTPEQSTAYVAQGFEVAVHIFEQLQNWTPSSLASDYSAQLEDLRGAQYPEPTPRPSPTERIASSGATGPRPKVELEERNPVGRELLPLPGCWIGAKTGFMNGGGFPMRFAELDGTTIDVYQAATQHHRRVRPGVPGHDGRAPRQGARAAGYSGIFAVNVHTDHPEHTGAEAMIAAALAHAVPVISEKQLLTWVDGRNSSTIRGLVWNAGTLTFGTSVGSGANGLQTLLPTQGPTGTLSALTCDGSPTEYALQTIKGLQYAVFAATTGTCSATY